MRQPLKEQHRGCDDACNAYGMRSVATHELRLPFDRTTTLAAPGGARPLLTVQTPTYRRIPNSRQPGRELFDVR